MFKEGVFSVSFWNFRHLSAQQVVGTGALVPEVVVLEHWRKISFQKRRNKRITEYVDNQHHIRRLCLDTVDLGNHYASCSIYSKTITDLGSWRSLWYRDPTVASKDRFRSLDCKEQIYHPWKETEGKKPRKGSVMWWGKGRWSNIQEINYYVITGIITHLIPSPWGLTSRCSSFLCHRSGCAYIVGKLEPIG